MSAEIKAHLYLDPGLKKEGGDGAVFRLDGLDPAMQEIQI